VAQPYGFSAMQDMPAQSESSLGTAQEGEGRRMSHPAVCTACGSVDIEYLQVEWWDELAEAVEWSPDEHRDALLLAWATQYETEILEAATNSFIGREHKKKVYDDPRRGWMTYVRNEYKWKPAQRNGTSPQRYPKQAGRY